MRIHRVREPVFIPVTRGRSLKSNGLLNKAKHSRRVSVKGQLEKFNRNYKMSVFTLGLEKSGRVSMKKNLSLRKKKRKEKKRKEKRKRGRRKKIKRKKNSLEARFDRVFKRRPKRQEKEFDTALSRDSLTSLADKRDFFQRGTNRRLCTRKLYPFVAL